MDFLRKSRVVAQLMNELANKLAQSVKTQDFKSLQREKINGWCSPTAEESFWILQRTESCLPWKVCHIAKINLLLVWSRQCVSGWYSQTTAERLWCGYKGHQLCRLLLVATSWRIWSLKPLVAIGHWFFLWWQKWITACYTTHVNWVNALCLLQTSVY